jgi:hypothetical protein
MKALLRVKLDVSLPFNSEGVDEEQKTRELDKVEYVQSSRDG